MEIDDFGGLDDKGDPVTQARIQAALTNRLPTTRDTIRHEKPLRAGYIKRHLSHGSSLGLQDRHSLISKTVFRRF